jgi:hypothetical protein
MLRPLFLPVSFDDIEEAAVAIAWMGRRLHAGIIYRSESGARLLLDLGIDGTIGNDRPKPKFAWAVPDVEPELLHQIAVLCEVIAEEPQPPCVYQIKYAPSSFTVDGDSISFGDGCRGLTCATLVLSIFHSVSIDLIDYNGWELRPDDERWENELVDDIQQGRVYGIDADAAQLNADDIPCLRYSPTDVIAACRADTLPITFSQANEQTEEIKAWAGDLRDVVRKRSHPR